MLALSISTTPASKESDALTVIGRRPQNKDAEGAVASANAVLFHGDVTFATLGQHAPDLTLMTKEEKPIQLSAAWGNGRHALIIFLRHLA